MERKIKKNSIGMFDIHKGIVMILIVCIHSIYIAEKCTPGFQYPLFVRGMMKTSSCGLALLFLISGYSFRPSPWKKSFFQQARNLLKPYAYSGAAAVCLLCIKNIVSGHPVFSTDILSTAAGFLLAASSNMTVGGIQISSIQVLWYLIAMFNSWLLLELFMKLGGGGKTAAAVLLCCAAGMAFGWTDIRFPFCIPQSMCCTAFLYCGWLLKKHKLLFKDYSVKIYGVCLAVYCVGTLVGDAKFYENIWKLWILELAIVLAGSFLAIEAGFFLFDCSSVFWSPFLTIGRYSLWVMCLHAIDMLVFQWEWVFRLPLPGIYAKYALLLVLRGLFIFLGCIVLKNWNMRWKGKKR